MKKLILQLLFIFSGIVSLAQGTISATQPITNATTTTGDSQGNTIVTWTGGNPIVGLVWSTATINTTLDPSTVAVPAANKTSFSFGWMASFNGVAFPASVASMTGLTCNTVYYVKAYIKDTGLPNNFIYSTEVSFTTPRVSISTTAVTAITATSATSGGNITAVCGITANNRGICWNTAGSPTTADATAPNGTGIGAYPGNLTGLSGGITYYVRSYVVGSDGITY